MHWEWKLNSGMRQIRFPESSISDLIFKNHQRAVDLQDSAKSQVNTPTCVFAPGQQRWPPTCTWSGSGCGVPPKRYISSTWLPSPPRRLPISSLASFFQSDSIETSQFPLSFYSNASKPSHFLREKAGFLLWPKRPESLLLKVWAGTISDNGIPWESVREADWGPAPDLLNRLCIDTGSSGDLCGHGAWETQSSCSDLWSLLTPLLPLLSLLSSL